MGVGGSLLAHTIALAALAAWSKNADRAQFAGHQQAIMLTVSFERPRWDVEQSTLKFQSDDPPVVIQPTEAQIAKRRYVLAPTIRPAVSDAAFASTFDAPAVLPRRASADEAPQPPEQELTPAERLLPRKPLAAEVAVGSVAAPPTAPGNTEETPPDLSRNAPPAYPALAIERRWEGTVLLRVWIDETGAVTRVGVARSSGHEILDGAAAGAVRRWKASPARRAGRPVPTVELLPVRFQL
jgi:protein TonB